MEFILDIRRSLCLVAQNFFRQWFKMGGISLQSRDLPGGSSFLRSVVMDTFSADVFVLGAGALGWLA